MERLDVLLRQLLASELGTQHYHHVALRLLRRLSHGTRGTLELQYLLDDLLASIHQPHQGDKLHDDIRQLAELLSSTSVPLRANPLKAKRHLSADPEEKDARGEPPKRTRRALEDAQMLYNYLVPLPSPVGSAAGAPPSSAPSIKSLFAKPGDPANSSISDSLGAQSLQQIFAHLQPLIPERGRFIERRREVGQLCDLASPSEEDTLVALTELGDMIAELCAPVRDADARILRDSIAACRQYRSLGGRHLQEGLVNSLRQAAALVNHMHRDMKQFSLGLTTISHSEADLAAAVRDEGMKRERAAIEDLLDSEGPAPSRTAAWIQSGAGDGIVNRASITAALLDALFSTEPVSMPPAHHGSPSGNILPPILYLARRHLLLLQSWLQAIVVLATLSTLVPVQTAALDWSERVWTLLASEVEPGNQESRLCLDTISDEIIRATSSDRAVKTRSDVERMVRLGDPVYRLLSRRLTDGLAAAVAGGSSVGLVQGFQTPPLPMQIDEVFGQILRILSWACECWQIPT